MPTIKDVAFGYIERARQETDIVKRQSMLRSAAADFARLASHPSNAKQKAQLAAIGLEFAGAALRSFQPVAPGLLHDLSTDARAFHALNALYPEGVEEAAALGEGPSIRTPLRASVQPSTFTEETTLGRIASVTFNPTPEQISADIKAFQTVAMWQGKKTEAQAMSIDFGLAQPAAIIPAISGTFIGPPPGPTVAPQPLTARLYADIQYGVDGNTQNVARVDVGLGRRVNLVANYIVIGIGMDAPSPSSGDTCPVLVVGGSIGSFASPSHAPVIRTVYADREDFENIGGIYVSKGFPIPQRAIALLPFMSAGTAGVTDTVGIVFFTYGGNVIDGWDITFGPTNPLRSPMPIPPDAFSFIITKSSAFPPATGPGAQPDAGMRIPFELTL